MILERLVWATRLCRWQYSHDSALDAAKDRIAQFPAESAFFVTRYRDAPKTIPTGIPVRNAMRAQGIFATFCHVISLNLSDFKLSKTLGFCCCGVCWVSSSPRDILSWSKSP